MKGTVTIPLVEYHRLLKCDEALEVLEKEADLKVVLLQRSHTHEPCITILGANEVMKDLAAALTARITELQAKLLSKNKVKSGWFGGYCPPEP